MAINNEMSLDIDQSQLETSIQYVINQHSSLFMLPVTWPVVDDILLLMVHCGDDLTGGVIAWLGCYGKLHFHMTVYGGEDIVSMGKTVPCFCL